MAVIEVRDLGIRFGGLQALDSFNFKAEEYEIAGIMGPNGAGKTTAFNLITGIYAPTSGSVWYRGQEITELRPDQRAALGIGRTFQQVGLVRSMTVLENLLTAQHARVRYPGIQGLVGWPTALAEERQLRMQAMEVLDFMGLAHLRNAYLGGLPYGTLKRVETAAVLATDPDLLLLDEPSEGLAPAVVEAMARDLVQLKQEGVSVLLSEQNSAFTLALSDRVYIIEKGVIRHEDTAEGLNARPEIMRTYLAV